MDLSFTIDGGTLRLGNVSMEDIPRAVTLLRQSFREPPMFESEGLRSLHVLPTEEIYERYLSNAQAVRMDPVSELFDITQMKWIERAYLYRAELRRRTRERSRFVIAYEAYLDTHHDARDTRIQAYNHLLIELGKDFPLVFESYEEQKRTKEVMLDIMRRPQVVIEINQTLRSILSKVDRTRFKYHLTPAQCCLVTMGSVEDESLDTQEELLVALKRMLEKI